MINTKEILKYLENLSKNNNRDWFHDHVNERKHATLLFEELVEELEYAVMDFDTSVPFYPAKELTFKQVRDTRFSKDKTPYNPSFRAHISSKGKLPIPVGYFICFKPNNESFIGGGLFADMFSDATNMIREYLAENSDEFIEIISKKQFKENFNVEGVKLKNVPKQFDQTSPVAEFLKYKSWFLEYNLTDEEISNQDKLVSIISEKFKLMKEFNEYLNKALIHFQMPSR